MTLKPLPMPWIILLALNIIFGIALIMMPKTGPEPSHMNDRLSEIQSQLTTLQQTMKAPAPAVDLSEVSQQFHQLTTLMDELKTKDAGQILAENQTQLSNKLDAMHTVIQSLDNKQHPIHYLPVSALPFTVISIDSIQQVSVASVAYDYKTIPLEKSDTLAGWTILCIDFGTQKMELENTAKDRVVVTLEGVEPYA